MTTLRIRNIDRQRPVPDCTCFICGASVKLLRSMKHPETGKHTAGCEQCFQTSVVASHKPVLAAPGELVDETPPAPEHYCISCFEPYAAMRPHQRRCHDCAETIAAQWSAKPPAPKPPKLELVKQPKQLAPMVLSRALWLQAWADWQQAHNPAVLIRRLDANIKAGPGVVKCTEVPSWERWSEAEFRQRMVIPKAA